MRCAHSIKSVSAQTDTLPGDGFVATALTDAEYPRRAALSMCTSIVQEFGIKFPSLVGALKFLV